MGNIDGKNNVKANQHDGYNKLSDGTEPWQVLQSFVFS